jgi:predicted dehydrogenase
MEKVRVGVIGAIGIADFVHLPTLKSHPRAEVAAVCARNRERAAEAAAKYEIPSVYTDYREMIARADLDAVVVATPDDLHYPMVMDALDAGLHVLCEKPLACNGAQARAMYEKAETVGVVHMVFFNGPWLTHLQRLTELVKEGYIGRPYHCKLNFIMGYARGPEYMWRFDGTRANGVLGDLGSHMIQFARLYMGEIVRVSARLHSFVARTNSDGQPVAEANDAAALLVEFENGSHGTIDVSALTYLADRIAQESISLYGEGGTLEAGWSFIDCTLRGARSGAAAFEDFGSRVFGPEGWTSVFDVFYTQSVGDRLFIDAILEGRQVSPSFYDGLKVQEVIDAAIVSDREGRWVTVADGVSEI